MGKELKEKYERVCAIKDRAISLVETQLSGNIENVDAKELGEVADIAKDMAELMKLCAEAEYYNKVVEAMDEGTKEEKSHYLNKYIPEYEGKFYTPMHTNSNYRYHTKPIETYDPNEYMRDMDLSSGRMYYTEPMYRDSDMMTEHYVRDAREGNSPLTRKHYMEIKNSDDKIAKAKELELYIKELGEDITDMLNNATTEEKTLVKQKLTTLVNKM